MKLQKKLSESKYNKYKNLNEIAKKMNESKRKYKKPERNHKKWVKVKVNIKKLNEIAKIWVK